MNFPLNVSIIDVEAVGSSQNVCHGMCVMHPFSFLCLGIPDPPEALEAFNISHHAVLLTWSSGFDGGLTQSFLLRVQKIQETTMTFVSIPINITSYTLSGLSQGTAYQVSIAAKNMLGESQYTAPITFRTKSK